MSNTYYARAYYTGNGTQSQFALPFPYIYPTDVYLYQNGTLDTTTTITFLSANLVQLAPVPIVGAAVELVRQTVETSVLAQIQSGSISANDINLDTQQLLYLIQEINDDATYLNTTVQAELAAILAILAQLTSAGLAALLAALAALGTPLVAAGPVINAAAMNGIGVLVVKNVSPLATAVSLQAAPATPYRVLITDGGFNAQTGPITVSSPDGYHINGEATYVINSNGKTVQFVFVSAAYGFIAE